MDGIFWIALLRAHCLFCISSLTFQILETNCFYSCLVDSTAAVITSYEPNLLELGVA